MIILVLDTEQANILKDAAMAANNLLNLRTARADPDGVVSKAIALQTRKINQVFDQLAFPSVPDWNQLAPQQQVAFLKMCSLLHEADTKAERVEMYRQMFAFITASRIPPVDPPANPQPHDRPS